MRKLERFLCRMLGHTPAWATRGHGRWEIACIHCHERLVP